MAGRLQSFKQRFISFMIIATPSLRVSTEEEIGEIELRNLGHFFGWGKRFNTKDTKGTQRTQRSKYISTGQSQSLINTEWRRSCKTPTSNGLRINQLVARGAEPA
jgi:hypothetical protein